MPNKKMEQRLIELRRQAQAGLKTKASDPLSDMSEEALHLLEELHIHQIELELQNEELHQSQQELETAQEAYRALYEFAPIGYFTLTDQGVIVHANPEAAKQLGVAQSALLLQRLAQYVARENQESFFQHRRQTLKSKERQSCELRLVRADGAPFYVHMESLAISEESGEYNLRTAIINITERKQFEYENEELIEALQHQNRQIRALSLQLTEAQEAERKQLAQELHDRIGQNLTAIRFQLDHVKAQLANRLPGGHSLDTNLDTALGLLDETTDRVRDLLAELRPPVLDDYGLLAALEWYGEEFTRWSGVSIQTHGQEPSPRLTPLVENGLLRILQEALNNVAKHAQASEVVVSLQPQAELVRLIITDNGLGLKATQKDHSHPQKSWGLQIMAERAEMIGGLCRIESQPGQGTRVMVEVPARPEGEEREEKRREEKRREEKRREEKRREEKRDYTQ